ncbi:MAG: hypothetical protein J5527_11100 [Treponema sp.]|nr:hypothetical protein [Treponema sp.]
MDIKQYLKQKGMETASIELIKQVIQEDSSLSQNSKKEFISTINTFSSAKNMAELLMILSGRM